MLVLRRVVLLALIMLILTALPACGGDSDDPDRAATASAEAGEVGERELPALVAGREFTSPDGRYSLRVPADWIREERSIADFAFHSTEPGRTIRFNVSSERNTAGRPLQGYAQAARETVEETFTNVLTVSFTPVVVDGREAMRWMYTATVSNVNQLYYQVYVVEADRAYVLTGIVAADANPDEVRDTLDQVAGSFKLGRG